MATPISLPGHLNAHQAVTHHVARANAAAEKGDLALVIEHLKAALDAARSANEDFDQVVDDHMDALRENAGWDDPRRDPLRPARVDGFVMVGDGVDQLLSRVISGEATSS